MFVQLKDTPMFLALRPIIVDHGGVKTLDNEDEAVLFFSQVEATGGGGCKFAFDANKGLIFGCSGECVVTDSHHYIVWREDKTLFEVLSKSEFDTKYTVTEL